MLRMNRETPIHSSGDESLVIVDNQRRKRLAIIGAAVVALIAHPDDERYQPLFGRTARTPLFGVEVPIVEVVRFHPRALVLGMFAATATFVLFYLMTVFALSWVARTRAMESAPFQSPRGPWVLHGAAFRGHMLDAHLAEPVRGRTAPADHDLIAAHA